MLSGHSVFWHVSKNVASSKSGKTPLHFQKQPCSVPEHHVKHVAWNMDNQTWDGSTLLSELPIWIAPKQNNQEIVSCNTSGNSMLVLLEAMRIFSCYFLRKKARNRNFEVGCQDFAAMPQCLAYLRIIGTFEMRYLEAYGINTHALFARKSTRWSIRCGLMGRQTVAQVCSNWNSRDASSFKMYQILCLSL